jgi:protein O-mannosyl-transferase
LPTKVSPVTRRQTRSYATIACGVAALLAALVYVNALHNPFAYDDYVTVVSNRSIGDLTNVRAIVLHDMTRPIINLSYAIDRAVWDTDSFGYHVTNVAFHIVNVVLLFALTFHLTEDRRAYLRTLGQPYPPRSDVIGLFAAVLLGVHPMMTEAVGYISGRSEVVSTTWFLLALLSGRRWMRGDGARWGVLTVVLWLSTLATKEIGAMFPLVLLAYDYFVVDAGGSADRRRRLWAVHLPLIGTAVAAGLVRLVVFARLEHPEATHIQWSYGLMQLDVLRRYVGMLFVPAGQSIFHDVSPTARLLELGTLLGIATLVAMSAVAWSVRRVAGLAAFGIVWFLLLLVPSTALVLLGRGEPMTEHRIYLASCGLFIAAGVAAARTCAWAAASTNRIASRVTWTVLAAMIVTLCILTVMRNAVWHSPITLWAEAVDRAPNRYRPRLLLGQALQDEGRRAEALEQYQVALRLRPQEETAYMKLGLCLAELGRLDEAAAAFNKLRALNPRSAFASAGLGAVAMLSRQPAVAREHYLDALKKDPRSISARQSLAMLDEMDPPNPGEALRLCEEIERLAPGTPGNDECIRRNRARLERGDRR